MVGSLKLLKQRVNETHQLKGTEDYIPERALRISAVRQAERPHLGPLLILAPVL